MKLLAISYSPGRVLTSLALVLLALAGCDKTDFTLKRTQDFVNGDSSLKGVVFFLNPATGQQDTAQTALLTLDNTADNPDAGTLNCPLKRGKFEVRYLNGGSYSLSGRLSYQATTAGPVQLFAVDTTITLTSGATVDKLRLVLKPVPTAQSGVQLSVATTDSLGYPLAGVQVRLFGNEAALLANRAADVLQHATTNAQGGVFFTGLQAKEYWVAAAQLAGTDTIRAGAAKIGPLSGSIINQASLKLLAYRPKTATAQFVVVNAAGLRVPGAVVGLYPDSTLIRRSKTTWLHSLQQSTSTAQGEVHFSGLKPRTYVVAAVAVAGSDTLTSAYFTFSLKAGGTPAPVFIHLRPASSLPAIRVTVTNSLGQRLPGTKVALYPDSTAVTPDWFTTSYSLQSGTTNAQGQVLFTRLPLRHFLVGAYRVINKDTLTNFRGTAPTRVGPPSLQAVLETTVLVKP